MNNTQPHFFMEDGILYLLWAYCVSYPYDHDVYFEWTMSRYMARMV